jgi:hypothetical protein
MFINRRCPKSQQVQNAESQQPTSGMFELELEEAVGNSRERGWGASGAGQTTLVATLDTNHFFLSDMQV